MDYIGKSSVPTPILVIGKAALFGSVLFPLVRYAGVDAMIVGNVVVVAVAALLAAAGLTIVIAGVYQLGESVAVGLPERKTELRTGGLYRFSRNPIYLGAFMACAGSCLVAPHPANFVLFAIAVAVHMWIIRREEDFLEQR